MIELLVLIAGAAVIGGLGFALGMRAAPSVTRLLDSDEETDGDR